MIEPRVVSVRIPPGILKLIEQDIQRNEEYINRTEWIMDAVRMHLDRRIQGGAIQRDSIGGGGGQTNP